MKILCDQCKKEFEPSMEQSDFIATSKSKGMTFIMLDCSLCSRCFPLNPSTLELPIPKEPHLGESLRCPEKTCYGIISYINEKPPFWGCGECGTVWHKIEDLYSDIKNIIKKYPYRAKVYKARDGAYYPVPEDKIPKSYDDKVRSEWDDK